MCVRERVCVYVRERERETACEQCAYVRERERERDCVQHERVLVTRLHVCMAHASMVGGGANPP